ncbi:MAG TPA: hypothetical protein VL463_10365 [Kofleriaceae bacterium]|nr:hypothetical protein [Kofleriaceae bacterium]
MKTLAFLIVLVLAAAAYAGDDKDAKPSRNFAGSVQLDYLAVPTDRHAHAIAFDGATVELSMKLTQDFGDSVTSSVKVCVACHGLEVGMAYFDVRTADELDFRVGRFTPSFGSFPLRSDPANHRTSDKPLPYDMGRMLHFRDFDEGILPAPWVDNGLEINGTHFFGHAQLDYAAYAISGPKAGQQPTDFDYTLSRSPERYYVDNNSEPTVGARVATTIETGDTSSIELGASAMAGHYDPDAKLDFEIGGADLVVQIGHAFLRAEYLVRRTRIALGDDPAVRLKYGPNEAGVFDDHVLKEGFYGELELPIADGVTFVGRWDGLRRRGNVLATSELRSDSVVLRYTAAFAFRVHGDLLLKMSTELYDFSDFDDEAAIHLGLAGPF